MKEPREAFHEFLGRLTSGGVSIEDWQHFAVTHYADEDLEAARRELVAASIRLEERDVTAPSAALREFAGALLRGFHENGT